MSNVTPIRPESVEEATKREAEEAVRAIMPPNDPEIPRFTNIVYALRMWSKRKEK